MNEVYEALCNDIEALHAPLADEQSPGVALLSMLAVKVDGTDHSDVKYECCGTPDQMFTAVCAALQMDEKLAVVLCEAVDRYRAGELDNHVIEKTVHR
jgi:hypothetical protein